MKIQIPYYNSFWLKNVKDAAYDYRTPQWPGFKWQNGSAPYASYPTYPFGNVVGGAAGAYNTEIAPVRPGVVEDTTPAERWWYIEESRIRGGYNNTSIELGVRAYVADNNKIGVYKGNSLIFSGIYNSSTEFNEANVFSIAEPITRSLNPAYGDIKKLYTAETNLVVFQETKTSKILVNKNQAYNNLEGSTDNSRVLGQVSPYVGKYGISDYPESFGVYANRRYFVDKNKGVVLRLSNDGLTEISNYGMRDFFRDTFESISEEPEVNQVLDNSGSSKIGVIVDNNNATSDIFTMKLLNINCCDITPGTLILLDDPANPGNAIDLEDTRRSELVYVNSIDCSTNLVTLSSTNNVGRIFPAPVQSFTTSISLLSTGQDYTTGTKQTETTGNGVGLTINLDVAGDGSGGTIVDVGSGYQTGDVVTLLENGSSNSAQYTVTLTPITGGWNYVYLQNFYSSKIYGGYDIHNDNYTLSIQSSPAIVADSSTYESENNVLDLSKNTYKTLSFDESVKGWVSFYSFKPTWVGSIRNIFISTNKSSIYFHYDQTISNNRGKFYNATTPAKANVTFLFNDFPNTNKNFNTISYEGASGWEVEYVKSDFEGVNYINSSWEESQDSINSVRSYLQGKYELNNPTNTGLNALNGPFGYAGFSRKENRYVSNIVNNSVARPNEIIFGNKMSGIKGFFVETKLSIDTVTEPGGMKELFSVGTNFVQSS